MFYLCRYFEYLLSLWHKFMLRIENIKFQYLATGHQARQSGDQGTSGHLVTTPPLPHYKLCWLIEVWSAKIGPLGQLPTIIH